MHEKILNPAQSLAHGIYASQIDLCPNKFYAWMVLTFPTWRVRQNLAGIWQMAFWHGCTMLEASNYWSNMERINHHAILMERAIAGGADWMSSNLVLCAGKAHRVGRKWKGKNFPRDLSHWFKSLYLSGIGLFHKRENSFSGSLL